MGRFVRVRLIAPAYMRCSHSPKEIRLPRPPIRDETPIAPQSWQRKVLLIGGMVCLAIALIGFVVFALRAVSIA